MPIHMAFKNDYIAIDEKSQKEVQDVLCMQTESTDRQGYPLYNGVKMVEKFNGMGTLDANVPGLTTNTIIEGVTFDPESFYDMGQYMTNSGKLKTCHSGLRWFTLSRQKPVFKIRIKLNSKTKFMNPYTFFGLLTYVPKSDHPFQLTTTAETTNGSHVMVTQQTRYNEWNPDFNFKKV
jgi:hypothetical protein